MANTYTPDIVFPPGDTLRELLDARDMRQQELADRIAMSTKAVSQLMTGKMALTHETALKLEHVLGVNATFWLSLENNYRVHLARLKETEQLAEEADFLKCFSKGARRIIGLSGTSITEKLGALYSYFEVANRDAWERTYLKPSAMFRETGSGESDPYAVATVLRYALLKAKTNQVPYNEANLRAVLKEVRSSGHVGDVDYLNTLPTLLAPTGLTLIVMDAIPKCRISGAVQWQAGKPVVLITTRHKFADIIWFTFFHEMAHVLLHKGHTFIDTDFGADDGKELEANTWAANTVIPSEVWDMFIQNTHFTKPSVREFAETQRLHPGVVAGRLEFEKRVPHTTLHSLKLKLKLDGMLHAAG